MRRVAIAGVVALQPAYLILDEPSAGLDPRGRDEIFAEVVRLHETTGVTVVLISHNMEEVARLVKRLVVMHDGAIGLDGPPREIFRHGGELKAAGVDVPGVTALMARLAHRGLDVDAAALTVEEAAASIAAAVRRRGAC